MKFLNIHWLQPPNFPGDQNKTQQAHILHVTLLSFLIFVLLALTGIWLGGRSPLGGSLILVVLFMICLTGYYSLRKGFVTQTGIGLIALTFIFITIGVANLGTIRAPITTAYYAVIIISGLLFDLPGLITMIIMSSLAIGGLIVAQNSGMLPTPDETVTITQWTTYVSLFITNGGLTIFVILSIRRSLHRAEVEIVERKRAEEALKISEEQLQKTNAELQNALDEVKTLNGMLPICSHCKKIRDDKGYWNQLEAFIIQRTDATFTHGICPDCAEKYLNRLRKE